MYLFYVTPEENIKKKRNPNVSERGKCKTINRISSSILIEWISVICFPPGFTSWTSSETKNIDEGKEWQLKKQVSKMS